MVECWIVVNGKPPPAYRPPPFVLLEFPVMVLLEIASLQSGSEKIPPPRFSAELLFIVDEMMFRPRPSASDSPPPSLPAELWLIVLLVIDAAGVITLKLSTYTPPPLFCVSFLSICV